MQLYICICDLTDVHDVANRCVEVWNDTHGIADQVSLSSVLAVKVLWGSQVPEGPRAPDPAAAGFEAPAPPAAEATPRGGRSVPAVLEDLSAAFATLSLRARQVEEAAGDPPTPEVCEILRLKAMSSHLNNRLDKAEQCLKKAGGR